MPPPRRQLQFECSGQRNRPLESMPLTWQQRPPTGRPSRSKCWPKRCTRAKVMAKARAADTSLETPLRGTNLLPRSQMRGLVWLISLPSRPKSICSSQVTSTGPHGARNATPPDLRQQQQIVAVLRAKGLRGFSCYRYRNKKLSDDAHQLCVHPQLNSSVTLLINPWHTDHV